MYGEVVITRLVHHRPLPLSRPSPSTLCDVPSYVFAGVAHSSFHFALAEQKGRT